MITTFLFRLYQYPMLSEYTTVVQFISSLCCSICYMYMGDRAKWYILKLLNICWYNLEQSLISSEYIQKVHLILEQMLSSQAIWQNYMIKITTL